MKCNPCRTGGELYRIPKHGKVAGVCAGLAEYLGWETWLVRILIVSGVLFGMPFLVMIYIAGWFILDVKPNNSTNNEKDNAKFKRSKKHKVEQTSDESIKVKARIWQSGEPPRQAFHDIKYKFNGLEKQLRAMESYVTSAEFTVSREINKL